MTEYFDADGFWKALYEQKPKEKTMSVKDWIHEKQQPEKYTGIVMDHPLIKDLIASLPIGYRQAFMRLVGASLRDNWRGTPVRAPRYTPEGGAAGGKYLAVKNCPSKILEKAFASALDRLKAPSTDQTTTPAETPAAPVEPTPTPPAAVDVEDLIAEVRHMVNTLNALCAELASHRDREEAFRKEIARLTVASRRAMAVYGD